MSKKVWLHGMAYVATSLLVTSCFMPMSPTQMGGTMGQVVNGIQATGGTNGTGNTPMGTGTGTTMTPPTSGSGTGTVPSGGGMPMGGFNFPYP